MNTVSVKIELRTINIFIGTLDKWRIERNMTFDFYCYFTICHALTLSLLHLLLTDFWKYE